MKIYCDSNLDQQNLLYWADKPFWVLCDIVGYRYWIKVFSHRYGGEYYMSYITSDYVDYYYDELIWRAELPSSYISHAALPINTDIHPVFPIEVLTDSEFNAYMTDNDAKWAQEH